MNNADNQTNAAMLKEYELLRQELIHINVIRFNVLAFTIVAVGTILGLLGDRASTNKTDTDYFVFVLSTFALGLLLTAQVLTIYYSQKIRSYGSYIRTYIELKISGLQWETRLFQQRTKNRSRIIPPATSQPLALYYAFLSTAVTLVSCAINQNYSLLEIVLIIGFLAINLLYSLDLLIHFTAGWKSEWPLEPDNEQS